MRLSVHPRVCGEREVPFELAGADVRFIPACAGNARASPGPKVRGCRFIPACAGNAYSALHRCASIAVHPRVCGERRSVRALRCPKAGSSPRVRGTRAHTSGATAHKRFIPACAGNAMPPARPRPWRPVHPRVCGERRQARMGNHERNGSSPRVRGTRGVDLERRLLNRFIPACAGNA